MASSSRLVERANAGDDRMPLLRRHLAIKRHAHDPVCQPAGHREVVRSMAERAGRRLHVDRERIVDLRVYPGLPQVIEQGSAPLGEDHERLVGVEAPRSLLGDTHDILQLLAEVLGERSTLTYPAVEMVEHDVQYGGLKGIQPAVGAPKLRIVPLLQS